MRDKSDRYRVQTVPTFCPPKRIGTYLVEAGLITHDQVTVALNDQQATGMKFGEVLVARGWLKEQTIEWVMKKVVLPERKAQQRAQHLEQQARSSSSPQPHPQQPYPQPMQGRASQGFSQPQASPGQRPSRPQPAPGQPIAPAASSNGNSDSSLNKLNRRELPISKPLPPVNSSDDAVNWVG